MRQQNPLAAKTGKQNPRRADVSAAELAIAPPCNRLSPRVSFLPGVALEENVS
jgi:hypothetical protein